MMTRLIRHLEDRAAKHKFVIRRVRRSWSSMKLLEPPCWAAFTPANPSRSFGTFNTFDEALQYCKAVSMVGGFPLPVNWREL